MLTFSNFGNQDYSITLDAGAAPGYGFAVSPPSGLVSADGGTVGHHHAARRASIERSVRAGYNGTQVSTTVALDTPHSIPLTQNAHGAIIAFDPAPPNPIPFSDTAAGAQGAYQLAVTSSDSRAAVVNFTGISNSVFSFDQGQSAARVARRSTPTRTSRRRPRKVLGLGDDGRRDGHDPVPAAHGDGGQHDGKRRRTADGFGEPDVSFVGKGQLRWNWRWEDAHTLEQRRVGRHVHEQTR